MGQSRNSSERNGHKLASRVGPGDTEHHSHGLQKNAGRGLKNM